MQLKREKSVGGGGRDKCWQRQIHFLLMWKYDKKSRYCSAKLNMFVSKCRGHQLHAFIDLGTEIKTCIPLQFNWNLKYILRCVYFFSIIVNTSKQFLLFIHVIIIMTDQLYLTVNAFCQEKGYHAGRWTIQQGSSKGAKALSNSVPQRT